MPRLREAVSIRSPSVIFIDWKRPGINLPAVFTSGHRRMELRQYIFTTEGSKTHAHNC